MVKQSPTISSVTPVVKLAAPMNKVDIILVSVLLEAIFKVSFVVRMLKMPPITNPVRLKIRPKTMRLYCSKLTRTIRQAMTIKERQANKYWICLYVKIFSALMLFSQSLPRRREPMIAEILKIIGTRADWPFQPLLSMYVGSQSRNVQSIDLKRQPEIRNKIVLSERKHLRTYSQNSVHYGVLDPFYSLPSCEMILQSKLFSSLKRTERYIQTHIDTKIAGNTSRGICQEICICKMKTDDTTKPITLPTSADDDQNPIKLPCSELLKQFQMIAKRVGQMLC